MPQIDQIGAIYASQLFWLVIVFALLYFGIGRAMVPKIQQTVDERHARIAGDIAAAEAARAAADAAETAYTAKLNESRAAALIETNAAKAKAAAAAEVHIKAANAEIAAKAVAAEARLMDQLVAASSHIDQIAAEAARDIVSRVAGLDVTTDQAAGAVVAATA